MWKLDAPALALALMMSMATPVMADEQPPVCPVRWGEPGRALVTTAETAKTIFRAIEADFFPAADREGYPEIVAHDGGDWWSVFRYRPPEPQPNGDILITAGGGQLSLRIAKCDAKITEVHFTR
tara:strand:- start:4 stop:375 length:372 start_codon:yes stop_codon:yes gene_type:complete